MVPAQRSSRRLASAALFAAVCAFLGTFSYPAAGLLLSLLALYLAALALLRIRAGRLAADGRALAAVALALGCVLALASALHGAILLPPEVKLWEPLEALRRSAIYGTPAP